MMSGTFFMNVNILVIEDEPDIRKNLEYNLIREGFKVSSVGSLNEAIKHTMKIC